MSAALAFATPLPTLSQPRGLVLFLRQLPGFERADDAALDALAAQLEPRRLKRGAALWRAGDAAREVGWVRSGVVWVHQDAGTPREVSVGYFGRGALLGVHGPATARADTAEMHEDGTVLVMRRAAFDAFLAAHPALLPAVITQIAERCRQMQQRLALVSQHGARARLAGLLLDLAAEFGVRDSRGVIVDLRLTHREIAGLIGATRETVSVAMVELRQEELIATEDRRVVLLRPDTLAAVAERPAG